MREASSTIELSLGLKAGDWVEVRSREEILSTLDGRGTLDSLPFMPEMLRFCGQRFPVYRAAHKTCDTIRDYKARRMTNTVHLPGLRCDGAAHGGCQAACLLFWKEAWLKRVSGPHPAGEAAASPAPAAAAASRGCTLESLEAATFAPGSGPGPDARWACQTTDLLLASRPLPAWEPTQYVQDLWSRNVSLRDFTKYMAIYLYNELVRAVGRGRAYGRIKGQAGKSTPGAKLDLKPGELVQVRSKEEIVATLNAAQRTRGLWFDIEMLPHCGKTYRVRSRVTKILDEKDGRMLNFPGDCIILEDVYCSGCLSRERMFCPRSIFPYWREVWLKRVS